MNYHHSFISVSHMEMGPLQSKKSGPMMSLAAPCSYDSSSSNQMHHQGLGLSKKPNELQGITQAKYNIAHQSIYLRWCFHHFIWATASLWVCCSIWGTAVCCPCCCCLCCSTAGIPLVLAFVIEKQETRKQHRKCNFRLLLENRTSETSSGVESIQHKEKVLSSSVSD